MASSRSMRNSPRTASPMDVATKASLAPENNTNIQKERLPLLGGWTEPPLRTPAPSFEDYKGLERGGVLEHMAPLGSVPNQKVKLRVKHYEPGRRYVQSKLGEGAVITKETVKETVKEPQAARRRSDSRRTEDHSAKVTVPQERDEDQDYTPKGTTAKSMLTKSTPSRSLHPETPSSRTNVGQERLRQVVDSAVERSRELGNEILGLAIRKLFEESLHNQTLADLLDAVLSQRPTPRQAADFQAYIKVARKQIKAENNASRRSSNAAVTSSSKSVSKSPSKPMRPTGATQNGTRQETPPTSRITQPSFPQPTSRGQRKEVNGNAALDAEHPAKRMKRTKSMSSTSSLSSLDSNDPSMELEASNPAGVRPLSNFDANFKGRSSLGPKLHTFSTVKYATTANSKRPPPNTGQVKDEPAAEVAAKRRKLQMNFEDYSAQDSNIRPSPRPRHLDSVPLPIMTGPSSLSSSKPPSRLHNGDNRTTQMDEHDSLRSPGSSIHGDFLVPPPPGAQHSSRGVTPTQLGRPLKPVRRAARVKISPMKKKSGVTAGFGRTGGGRDSPVGYFDENGDTDNVDYCTACSGNGQLLCCDGCTRSFHFTCLDPPMNPNHPPEGEWYCHICVSRRDPQPKPPRGLFSALLALLEKKNPVAFNLPEEIREYFECVKTGEEGEYEESTMLKPRSRTGYDEAPDYLKLKDSKGAFVLCYKCGKSSMGHREIIACDFCSLRWHLDCLDPPLANPPVRLELSRPRLDLSKPRHSWMCPNHIDSELLAISSETKAVAETQAGGIRIHKIRRPKNARIVDTALRRGFRNNGIIEIENEPTDDEEEMEREEFGVVYRLPERGIKLDFIDRVKRSQRDAAQRQQQSVRARDERKQRIAAAARAQREAFNKRPLEERQAAFNLAQFARSNQDIAIDADQVTDLISTLITEAPATVLALSNEDCKATRDVTMRNSSIPPTPPLSDLQEHVMGSKEREYLLMVQELIRRRLGTVDATEI